MSNFDLDTLTNSLLTMRKRLKAANQEIARLNTALGEAKAPVTVIDDKAQAETKAQLEATRSQLATERHTAKQAAKEQAQAAAQQASRLREEHRQQLAAAQQETQAIRITATEWKATAQREQQRNKGLAGQLAIAQRALKRALT